VRELPVLGAAQLRGLDPEAEHTVIREINNAAVGRGVLRQRERPRLARAVFL
jgi:hypothetical protein